MSFVWKKATFNKTDISGLSDAEAVKYILTGCANTIISTSTGWQLDTTNHSTQDLANNSPVDVNPLTNASKTPIFAYYFINSNSHDKMMLLYSYGDQYSATYNPLAQNYEVQTRTYNNNTNGIPDYDQYSRYGQPGLSISIISNRYSNENFGEDCSQSSFLPTHAVRLSSESGYMTYQYCLAYQRTSNYYNSIYNIYFGCDTLGKTIITVHRPDTMQDSRALPIRIYGKIYSSLANSNDLDDYGNISFYYLYGSSTYTTSSSNYGANIVPYENGMPAYLNYRTTSTGFYWIVSSLAHATSGDLWLSGSGVFQDESANAKKWFSQAFIVPGYNDTNEFNDYSVTPRVLGTASSAKCYKLPSPIVCYSYETDWMVNNYGIVPGSGIKGTLDQSVLTFIPGGSTYPYAKGTIIDNGYLVATSCYGICLGWDPSNDQENNPWYVAPV